MTPLQRLEQRVIANESQVAAQVAAQMTARNTDIAELKVEVGLLKDDSGRLIHQVTALKGDKKKEQKKSEHLLKNLQRLQAQYDQDKEQLKAKDSKSRAKAEKLEEEIVAMHINLGQVNTTLAELQERYEVCLFYLLCHG